MVKKYLPQLGDLISINFSPQIGREQRGFRPALVISASKYNQKVKLLICCPITSQIKNYPFEVLLPASQKTKGVVLSDQIKTIDWTARQIKFIEKINPKTLHQVTAKIAALLGIPH